jgi:hypothetical protein
VSTKRSSNGDAELVELERRVLEGARVKLD